MNKQNFLEINRRINLTAVAENNVKRIQEFVNIGFRFLPESGINSILVSLQDASDNIFNLINNNLPDGNDTEKTDLENCVEGD